MKKTTLKEILQLHEEKKLCGAFFLSNADYHAAPGISKSALDHIDDSPKFYKWKLDNPDELSEALIFGSVYHNIILQDEPFDKLFHITKTQPRDPVLDEEGRAPIAERHVETMAKMRKVFMEHNKASLFLNGLKEVSFFCTDPDTGVLVKTKADIFLPNGLVVDLKTTTSTDKEDVRNTIRERRYHVQGAFCLDVICNTIDQSGLELKKPDKFVLCFQDKREKSGIFDIRIGPIGPTSLVLGEKEYKANLATYLKCVQENRWPGKSEDDMTELDLPTWYIQRYL